MFILGNITFSDFWRHCYQTFVFDVCVHAWFVYFRLTCFESVWICSRGNQSQERSQAVSVTMGMEYKKYIYTNSSFSLFVVLLNKLFVVVVLLNKQFIWKLWKHYCEWCHFCDQQSVSVMLQMWASALCTFYNNPAPLNGSMQFHYCTLVTREPEQTTLLFWSAACGVTPHGLHTADRR